jgi:hypothetical protein
MMRRNLDQAIPIAVAGASRKIAPMMMRIK